MVKTTKDYYELICKLESFAKEKPDLYRLRVILLAALSYVVIGSLLIFVLGLSTLLILTVIFAKTFNAGIIKLLFVFGIMFFFILKSLWIKFHKPFGCEIKEKDSPELFQLIQELCHTLKVNRIHQVYIDYNYNAYITQIPRLGIFGFPSNYLVLGLPLMHAMTYEQFKGILAHELGHISRAHGKIGSSVYMIQMAWDQLLQSFDNTLTEFFLKKFANWYVPFFSAYSFLLKRNHEYEADKLAAETVGAKHFGEALIKLDMTGFYLDEVYWNKYYKRAIDEKEIPQTSISDLLLDLDKGMDCDLTVKFFDKSLNHKTNFYQVHPCLADRLKAIDFTPSIPQKDQLEPASQILLKNCYEKIVKTLNEDWAYINKPGWVHDHAYFGELKKSVQELENKANNDDMNLNEAWQLAVTKHVIHGKETALPLYNIMLECDPENPDGNFRIGTILLSNDDEAGIEHVIKAYTSDPVYKESGYWQLYLFYNHIKDDKMATHYHKLYIDHLDQLDLSRAERLKPIEKSQLQPFELEQEYITALSQEFKKYKEIKRVYIALREVQYLSEVPFLTVFLQVRWGFLKFWKGEEDVSVLINQIAGKFVFPEDFKGEIRLYSLGYYKNLEKSLINLKGSLIYQSE